jgi:hypothetical protein
VEVILKQPGELNWLAGVRKVVVGTLFENFDPASLVAIRIDSNYGYFWVFLVDAFQGVAKDIGIGATENQVDRPAFSQRGNDPVT